MVKASICGMCKNFIGLSDDKSKMLCKAFPDGITIDAKVTKQCRFNYHFEPKDEFNDFCSTDSFVSSFS